MSDASPRRPARRAIISTAGRDCLLPTVPLIRLAISPVVVDHPRLPDDALRVGSVCEGLDGGRVPVCRWAGRPGGCPLPGRATRLRSFNTTEAARTSLLAHYALRHLGALTEETAA